MPQGTRQTLLLTLAALLAGCPGSLPERDLSSTTGDMALGFLGGPCFGDNTCISGLDCSNGGCVNSSSSQEGGTTTPDGPQVETSTPTPDITPPTTDKTPPTPDQKITANGVFGSSCSAGATCSSGFTCIIIGSASSKGYCTKTCTATSKPCTGGPSGTQPYCILKGGDGKYYCVFLCKWGTGSAAVTAPCPKDLTCGTSENPPKSGQYICLP